MKALPIRMALYTGAALVAALGLGQFDAEAGTLTLHLNDIAEALAAAGAVNGLVWWKWGTKVPKEGNQT